MSKIKELLNKEDTVLVFDVDGVLALLEFGEYNHYDLLDDADWTKANAEGQNFYTEEKVSNKVKNFLKTKDMSRVYVITKVGNNNEGEYKRLFANKYYNIPLENVYYIDNDSDKSNKMLEIKKNYPDLEDYKVVMIDDTTEVLNDIQMHTKFSTAHVSSLLDI